MAAAVAMQRATGAVAGVWQQQQQQVEMGWRELGQALLLQRAAAAGVTGAGSMSRRACSSSNRAAAGRRGSRNSRER